jgi:hypothetical protein
MTYGMNVCVSPRKVIGESFDPFAGRFGKTALAHCVVIDCGVSLCHIQGATSRLYRNQSS